jgi:hypothetical protein
MNADTNTDADCPVSLDMLGRLYRADPALIGDMVRTLCVADRGRLALYCYSRAHLREVAMTIAATCETNSLLRSAGTVGLILAAQSAETGTSFGRHGLRSIITKRKITLAKSAA